MNVNKSVNDFIKNRSNNRMYKLVNINLRNKIIFFLKKIKFRICIKRFIYFESFIYFFDNCGKNSSKLSCIEILKVIGLRVLLNHASISIQFYPPPASSIELHPSPPTSFQPPLSSLQHPQRY